MAKRDQQEYSHAAGEIISVPAMELRIDDENNSRRYGADGIKDLAQEILALGQQLQPVGVVQQWDGYSVVYGFRRAKAIRMLNEQGMVEAGSPLRYVQCVALEEADPSRLFEMNVRENANRKELSPIDSANALDRLMAEHGHKLETAAAIMGRSKGWASQTLALLRLPEKIRRMIHTGKVAASTGYEIASLPEGEMLTAIEALERGLTERSQVRDAVEKASQNGDGADGEKGSGAEKKRKARTAKQIRVGFEEQLEQVDPQSAQAALLRALIRYCEGASAAKWRKLLNEIAPA